MKPDLHGIRFRFWLAFFSASVGIVVSLGVLQIGFIGPYYRNVKMHSIRNIAEDIAEYLSGDATDEEIGKAVQDTIRNNACVVMYNTKGKIIFQADSLGVGCIFNAAESRKPQQLNSMETIRQQMDENGSDFSLTFESAVTDNPMMVYGTKVNAPLSTYYLFVNTSLDPVYSAYSVFLSQYFIFTIVVMLLASAFAYFYSRNDLETFDMYLLNHSLHFSRDHNGTVSSPFDPNEMLASDYYKRCANDPYFHAIMPSNKENILFCYYLQVH